MTSARFAAFAALILIAGCDQPSPEVSGTPGNGAAPGAGSSLEQAAVDAGVVADAGSLSPVGLYRNSHEAGRDSLCIVPGKDGKMDFAMEAAFGEGIDCNGHGTARLSGDKLILNFARSACLAVVRYEGDRISFPGVMDVECQSLCSKRGSLEGVSIPRVARDENVARDARSAEGRLMCPRKG
ncbi:MAG: hypothetical protein AB7U35_00160 [Sphingobium sp.]